MPFIYLSPPANRIILLKTTIIVNPNSAARRTARRWPAIEDRLLPILGPNVDICFTGATGDGTTLTRQALADGAERIIVVGGDGTLNECVNGFFADGRAVSPQARIGLISTGTGGDFRRTLNLPDQMDAAIAVIGRDQTRSLDVGRISFVGTNGDPAVRHFINITTFGMGGLISNAVNSATWSKMLGGTAAFYIATLAAMVRYKNAKITLTTDTGFSLTTRVNTVGVCNGQYCGGGMFLAPQSKPDDGVLDLVIVGDFSLFQVIRDFPLLYSGKHLDHPLITVASGRRITVETDEQVLLDVDGESPGRLPATFEIIPNTINFIC